MWVSTGSTRPRARAGLGWMWVRQAAQAARAPSEQERGRGRSISHASARRSQEENPTHMPRRVLLQVRNAPSVAQRKYSEPRRFLLRCIRTTQPMTARRLLRAGHALTKKRFSPTRALAVADHGVTYFVAGDCANGSRAACCSHCMAFRARTRQLASSEAPLVQAVTGDTNGAGRAAAAAGPGAGQARGSAGTQRQSTSIFASPGYKANSSRRHASQPVNLGAGQHAITEALTR